MTKEEEKKKNNPAAASVIACGSAVTSFQKNFEWDETVLLPSFKKGFFVLVSGQCCRSFQTAVEVEGTYTHVTQHVRFQVQTWK